MRPAVFRDRGPLSFLPSPLGGEGPGVRGHGFGKPHPQPLSPRGRGEEATPQGDGCTVWNSSLILMPRPSEMRYSVSIDAEFLPSSICDK